MICNVTHDMLLMTEETFASIIPVMRVESVEDAIQKANDTRYGLSGCVFGRTAEEAQAVAVRLRAGAVSINDANLKPFVDGVAFTAFGESGVGPMSRSSSASIRRFVRTQALITNTRVSMPPRGGGEAAQPLSNSAHKASTVSPNNGTTEETKSAHPRPNLFWPRVDVSAVESAAGNRTWEPLETYRRNPNETSEPSH